MATCPILEMILPAIASIYFLDFPIYFPKKTYDFPDDFPINLPFLISFLSEIGSHRAYEVHASHQKDNRPEEHSSAGGHRQQNGNEVRLTLGFADNGLVFQGKLKPESPIWPIFNRNIYSFTMFPNKPSH